MYTANINELTLENNYFRKVLYTASNCQLVLMSIKPTEDIGEEIHHLDQVLFFVTGNGKAVLNDKEYDVYPESVFVVPAGTKHNFINTGDTDLKLYTVYAPSEHPDGTVHKTKAEAIEAEEHEHH